MLVTNRSNVLNIYFNCFDFKKKNREENIKTKTLVTLQLFGLKRSNRSYVWSTVRTGLALKENGTVDSCKILKSDVYLRHDAMKEL